MTDKLKDLNLYLGIITSKEGEEKVKSKKSEIWGKKILFYNPYEDKGVINAAHAVYENAFEGKRQKSYILALANTGYIVTAMLPSKEISEEYKDEIIKNNNLEKLIESYDYLPISVFILDEMHSNEEYYVLALGVAKSYKGKGIGKKTINAAIEVLNIKKLTISTQLSNSAHYTWIKVGKKLKVKAVSPFHDKKDTIVYEIETKHLSCQRYGRFV